MSTDITKADLELSPYDPADYLESDVAMSYYLTEAFHSGDEAVIIDAIGVIARAKGMTDIAEKSGLSRPSLYRGLSKKGKPQFGTILAVLKALNISLEAKALDAKAA